MGKDKLKRFEEIKTFPNVLEPPVMETYTNKGKWHQEIFKNDKPIVLELGCGKGEYSVGLAKLYPDKNFVGVDIKGNRIYIGAKECLEKGEMNLIIKSQYTDAMNEFNFFHSNTMELIEKLGSGEAAGALSANINVEEIERFRKKYYPESISNQLNNSGIPMI